jgi:hypothetical protein
MYQVKNMCRMQNVFSVNGKIDDYRKKWLTYLTKMDSNSRQTKGI